MNKVRKEVLKNGLTVLMYPINTIPKAVTHLWYGVGSKDEKDGQRGLAHLLEHMLFKGTKKLSESDINLITHKLSGTSNAFTSHDYTGYLFGFPSQNWQISLPVLADCMRNCTLKQDLLNAELKAVIQELKMYHDDFKESLCEALISTLFKEHPYHYPIIGFKQNLWTIDHANLDAFYKKYYVPNNATLVVVGDVNTDEVVRLAEKSFGDIPADLTFKKESFYRNPDIITQSITMYRDIQQPILTFAIMIPGLSARQEYIIDLSCYVLGEGNGSRLYKKIVEELQLASDIYIEKYDLFEESILFIQVDPIDIKYSTQIKNVINQEIEKLIKKPISDNELQRAVKLAQMDYSGVFEDMQKVAYGMGKLYLATGNENELFMYGSNQENLKERITQFFARYFSPSCLHQGQVLPLPEQEKEHWVLLQHQSDALDEVILNRKVRTSSVEEGSSVQHIQPKPIPEFHFPKPEIKMLPNGLKLLWHATNLTNKVDLILRFKAQYYDDPEELPGLYNFMCGMMTEGTTTYSGEQFVDALEENGISLNVQPGLISMSMLKEDLLKGLHLLAELLMNATFAQENLEKIRQQVLIENAIFWDTPEEFVVQLAKEKIFPNHPYAKNLLGTEKSIKKIQREDLLKAYKEWISPREAQLAIVGDLKEVDFFEILAKTLGQWQGNEVKDTIFPPVALPTAHEFVYPLNRDQTVLAFAGLSVSRQDPDYEALLLMDQIVTGGVLNSSNSYLFQLREQSGLFYTIGGSLVFGCDMQPGLIFIRTIVSNDRIHEAQESIMKTLLHATKLLTHDELEQAKNALINSFVDHFESNSMIAEAFIFIDRFNLPLDYFEKRAHQLSLVKLEQIRHIGENILSQNHLVTIKIGRLRKNKKD